jgi:hypothetical protein
VISSGRCARTRQRLSSRTVLLRRMERFSLLSSIVDVRDERDKQLFRCTVGACAPERTQGSVSSANLICRVDAARYVVTKHRQSLLSVPRNQIHPSELTKGEDEVVLSPG